MPNPFAELYLATRPRRVTKDRIVANATASRNQLFAEIIRGTPAKQMLQDGESIFDFVRLDKASTVEDYLPYEDENTTEMSVLSKIQAPWRLVRNGFNIAGEQLELESSESSWVRILENHRAADEQALYEAMEGKLFAEHDANAESKGTFEGKPWYSIFSYVTDNGLAPSGSTTVLGQSPSTKTDWRNFANSVSMGTFDANIFNAFYQARQNLNWNIPSPKDWVENTTFRNMNIITTEAAERLYANYLDNKSNRFRETDDSAASIGRPKFFNIPIRGYASLDAKISAGTWTYDKFLWLDWTYLHFVFHTKHFMNPEKPKMDPNKTNVTRFISTTWGNLFCPLRNRLGITVGTA